MDITIRRLTVADLETFYAFYGSMMRTQFPEYEPALLDKMLGDRYWTKEKYQKHLGSESRFIFGAFDNEKLVGIIDAESPFGGVSLCIWLMVDPAYQGKGIGNRLLKAWEDNVKPLGAHMIYLFADKRNKGFYEKMGFVLSGEFTQGWFGKDEYIFTKQVQAPKLENF